ncbi:hypothetical protein [Nocardia puris]|uniref:hypothetical protein n=1 Tax=Nocardia puris TaxID=208602 RepID=UPI002E1F51A9
MNAPEPFHDPVELNDELDDIIRAQEMLRLRMVALQARYRALQSAANEGRYDKPSGYKFLPDEFGEVNVESTTNRLDTAAGWTQTVSGWLELARASAVKVREYPPAEQVAQVESDRLDRRRSR